MKTTIPSGVNPPRDWHVLDAKDVVLGRVATQAARLLMGKHKPTFTPFLDMGDHVVVVNAGKVRLTGSKETAKLYQHHSGYPGGLKEVNAKNLRARHPSRLVQKAIAGMLPKTKLGKKMLKKLRVYATGEHPHQAQAPAAMEVPS